MHIRIVFSCHQSKISALTLDERSAVYGEKLREAKQETKSLTMAAGANRLLRRHKFRPIFPLISPTNRQLFQTAICPLEPML
jgi:hypothetical protein